MSEEDLRHLDLLSIFHYVVAGITGLVASFPLLHLVIGILLVTGSLPGPEAPPPLVGWFFIAVASIMILLGWTLTICVAMAGYFLARRERYTFCLVVAGVECLFFPFGTVLGVLTLIVLTKPEVKQVFHASTGRPSTDETFFSR